MTTIVVNIYHHVPTDNDVYIGRAGKGKDGYFGNPFRLGPDGDRQEVIMKYFEYLIERLATDKEFSSRILQLKDKNLVCFCAPKTCHGDIIARLLDG